MKYIRTKDGQIFEEQTELSYLGITYYKSKRYTNRFLLSETLDTFFCRFGGIERQTDNIKELCDCYSYDIETTRDFAVARSWKLHNLEREIYGCVKTDKGLIYIAKMNESGELELI